MSENIRRQVSEFIAVELNQKISEEEELFPGGVVNSMLAMRILAFIEGAFQITVDDDDLDVDNFRSVHSISAFVARKLSLAA